MGTTRAVETYNNVYEVRLRYFLDPKGGPNTLNRIQAEIAFAAHGQPVFHYISAVAIRDEGIMIEPDLVGSMVVHTIDGGKMQCILDSSNQLNIFRW
jgi:hypothetical protein